MGQLSVGGVSAQFRPALALLTESGTYTVPYAGWYRIIAIGHGAGGYGDDSAPLSTPAPGGAGGGGYLDKYLPAGAVLTATISDMASTLSYGGSALISAARGSGKTAGSVTGSGVVAFPSNGTDTPDVTPPDGIYDASLRSVGGAAGLRNDEAVSAAGGAGLFGGDGGDGGYALSESGDIHTSSGRTGSRGAGSGAAGNLYLVGSTTGYYAGAGGGGGYGGGGGKPTAVRNDAYYTGWLGAGSGGAGCVRIERIR
jgi:hypothetical protein